MWRRRWRDGGGAVRSHITRRRVLTWYLGVVLTLTALDGLLHWVAVRPTGLTRTFHADVGFAGDPLFQDRTAEVSLAFLKDDPALPRRFLALLRKSKLAPSAPTRRFVTDRSRTTLVDQARSFD